MTETTIYFIETSGTIFYFKLNANSILGKKGGLVYRILWLSSWPALKFEFVYPACMDLYNHQHRSNTESHLLYTPNLLNNGNLTYYVGNLRTTSLSTTIVLGPVPPRMKSPSSSLSPLEEAQEEE